MMENRWIDELSFGLKMLEWQSKGHDPMQEVSCFEIQTELGSMYVPTIKDYGTFEVYFTGKEESEGAYDNREQALRCAGRCWDKADNHIQSKN